MYKIYQHIKRCFISPVQKQNMNYPPSNTNYKPKSNEIKTETHSNYTKKDTDYSEVYFKRSIIGVSAA